MRAFLPFLIFLLACAPPSARVADPVVTAPTRPALLPIPAPGPLATATSIALGVDQSGVAHVLCAVLAGGKVRCLMGGSTVDIALSGPATRIAVGFGTGCAFVGDGVECWGPGPLAKRLEGVRAGKDLVASSDGAAGSVCVQGQDDTLRCVRFVVQGNEAADDPFRLPPGTTVRWLGLRCLLDSRGVPRCRAQTELPAGDYRDWQTLGVEQSSRRLSSQVVYSPHALGLDASGKVRARGSNFYGQLGLGVDLEPAQQLSIASDHACALVSGRVACWGESSERQVPRRDALALPACSVDQQATAAAYKQHQQAQELAAKRCMKTVCAPGTLDCHLGCSAAPSSPSAPEFLWVYRHDEPCLEQPVASERTLEPRPVWVPELSGVVQLAVTRGLSCALRGDGETLCWGSPRGFTLEARGAPINPRN